MQEKKLKDINKGDYTDYEIITIMNTYIEALLPKMNTITFKRLGKILQEKAKTNNVSSDYIINLLTGDINSNMNRERFILEIKDLI